MVSTGGETGGKGRTAFGPVVPRSAITSNKRIRLEQRTSRTGTQTVAHASFKIDLHTTRDILCRRSRIDFSEVRADLHHKFHNKKKKKKIKSTTKNRQG